MKVTINNLDHYGRGITKINNKICFVENALKNEIVDIKIVKEKKKYLEGEVINIIEKSPKRKPESCPYFKKCGGCNLQHIAIEDEKEFKEEKIKELLSKFTSFKNTNIKNINCETEFNYRNKVVFHVKNHILGFYERKTNNIIEVNNCMILDNNINKLIPILKKLVQENEINDITIKVGNITNEIMVKINATSINNYEDLIKKVNVLIINNKTITKQKEIKSIIGNKVYLISDKSFFQVNKIETKNLYDEILNIIKENNSYNVLDLYCGTGTIGIYISDYVKNILGIEVVKDAIKDANKNKELNNSTNINFICNKVENIIDSIDEKYDTIIVDPPRNGLDKKTISNIKKILPKTLIYVSCDPVTLVRDLELLKESYNIKYVKPFNMFPKTYHVETVVLLKQK